MQDREHSELEGSRPRHDKDDNPQLEPRPPKNYKAKLRKRFRPIESHEEPPRRPAASSESQSVARENSELVADIGDQEQVEPQHSAEDRSRWLSHGDGLELIDQQSPGRSMPISSRI